MERKVTIILLVAVVAFIGGCKRERINPFDPGNPNARVVYAPQTKIPSENPQLVKDTLIGDKVYLTYEEGATLPEFEEGDILIGLRGEGYLRKVKSCTVQGNQLIVETEQATIKEAFTRLMIDTTVDIVIPEKKIKLGKIDYHTKTKGYDIYVQSDPGSYSVKDGTMRFEWPNFVIEIRSGGNLAASFKAERVVLWSDLDLNFYYDFSLIDGLHLLTSMLHEDSLNFVNATLYMYTEIPLLSAEIPLVPPIGVPIPLGPIVVTPEVGINADLQSMLQITQSIFAQVDANFYAEVEAGAEYDHGDWHAIWEKNLTGDLNMDFGTSISVNCENQCGIELEANIKLFGVVGGGIWVLPYGYFDFYNPPFHYEGGVGVKGGAQLMLGICGWELEREFTLAEYEIELFESYQQQNLPPNAPTISGPDNAQVNESVTFTASATDPNGDNVAIRFDWGDGNISSWSSYVPSGQSVSMSHTYTTAGTYYVKAQAKDVNSALSGWSDEFEVIISGWILLIEDENEPWDRDLCRIYVRSNGNLIEFRVEFNGSWQDPHSEETGIDCGIFLDVDQDYNTGMNQESGWHYYPNDIGADYVAIVGYEGDSLWKWNSADTRWEHCCPFTYLQLNSDTNIFELGINLDEIGNPSAIDIVVSNITFPASDTAYWDWAPDSGHVTFDLSKGFIKQILTQKMPHLKRMEEPNKRRRFAKPKEELLK
mgnify:CR=1 FL=1